MKETYEFRLFERDAERSLKPSEGRVLDNAVRIVTVMPKDSLFAKVGLADRTLRMESGGKDMLVVSWSCMRRYTKKELEAAEYFLVWIRRASEPVGEEYSDLYDESTACPFCGYGARQVLPLRLPLGRIPKTVDIARTIAGEVVVSERFAAMVEKESMTGMRLDEVLATHRRKESAPKWYQLRPTTAEVEVAAETRFGNSPFDLDEAGEYRCPKGHVLGLRRLSELTVVGGSVQDLDFQATRAAAGLRQGVLRPEPMLIVSPRFREQFLAAGLKVLDFEVVHLAEETGANHLAASEAWGLTVVQVTFSGPPRKGARRLWWTGQQRLDHLRGLRCLRPA